MNLNFVNDILKDIDLTVDHPQFYQRVFSAIAQGKKNSTSDYSDVIINLCVEEYDLISRRLDRSKIQESPAVRNVIRTREIANCLIDDKGDLNLFLLDQAIETLQKNLYSLGPNRQYDAKRQEHLLNALKELQNNKEIQRLLKNVARPYQNRYAEQVVRETINAPRDILINDPQARRAVLAAWLCTLRQNVGSCFATAPAIIVHDEQPNIMLKDLIELLGTGRLKRTYGGVEYSIPLSASWGAGDLYKPILIGKEGTSPESGYIWLSPGMMAGLEAAELVDRKQTYKQRSDQAKAIISAVLASWPSDAPYVLTSAIELLRKAVMQSLQITEKELQDYENQPKAMYTGNLMMQAGVAAGGKTQKFTNFYTKFDESTNAFKAIADNALLKSWEFTLASFAETKLQFASWNLYSSLGLGPQDAGGVGPAIFAVLQEKLEQANRQVQELQYDYDQAYSLIRYLETRMRTATSEKEAEWIKLEYRTRRYEFDTLESMMQSHQYRAQRYSNLFDTLVDLYMRAFPNYFQEVYDADMHEVTTDRYDDSPAGFRLLYKHGRANTAQWTRIRTPNEFIDALASFFVMTESEISRDPTMEGLENDFSDITTAIVTQIRSREFLETSFHRIARAHHTAPIQDPLDHLDKIDKKPWAYTSGGTMDTLVSNYWKREQKPTEVGRWVENPTELLVFLVDTIKQIPFNLSSEYLKKPQKSMLIHSPTHAFLLKPGLSPLKELWQSDEFTYTAVRDKIIQPAAKFCNNLLLSNEKCLYLINQLRNKVAPNFQHYFKQVFNYFPDGMTPKEFREHIVLTMSKERGLAFGRPEVISTDEIDGMLFSLLPLFSSEDAPHLLENILQQLPQINAATIALFQQWWSELPHSKTPERIVNAKTLQDIAKSFLCLASAQTSSAYDYHWLVSQAAKKLGYAMPMPVIFADSNWMLDEFGFVFNPGTGKYELWRVDYTGSIGFPMSVWQQWLDGSRRERTWGVYTRPFEYSFN